MSAKGPPMGSLPHMTTSISSAALRSGSGSLDHSSQPATPSRMPPTKADNSRRLLISSRRSCAEGHARTIVGDQKLVRHALTHRTDEVLTAAMHRHDNVRVELLDLADYLLEVVGRCRTKMEAADDRMHLLDAGHFLRLPRRVHDPDMAAGADNHQPAVLHVETGGVLVQMLVRHDLALQLGRRVMAGVAAEPILHRELDLAVRQHAFLAGRREARCGICPKSQSSHRSDQNGRG